MFLWIRLLHDRLSPGKNAKQLQKVVSDTPTGLQQAYERDLRGIHSLPDEERDRAIAILRWTLFAVRPLIVREITEALLVDIDGTAKEFPMDDLPDDWDEYYINDQIRRPCGSLIELRGGEVGEPMMNQKIHFVHFSVEEYLLQRSNVALPLLQDSLLWDHAHAHNVLAQVCLKYLCYEDFAQDSHSSKAELERKLERYAFLDYAAKLCFRHACHDQIGSCVIDLINGLFCPNNKRWILWSDIHETMVEDALVTDPNLNRCDDCFPLPLYYASYFGLVQTMYYLLQQGADPNHMGGFFGTAIIAAAWTGSKPAVEVLLRHGADPNIQKEGRGSALMAAAINSNAESKALLQLLIDGGTDVQAQTSGSLETALHKAYLKGFIAFIQTLLDAGADVHAKSNSEEIALHIACSFGYEQATELLLESGSSIDACASDGRTPLHTASQQGKDVIVDLLLRKDANIEARDSYGQVALHLAALSQQQDVAKVLLEHGANVDARDVRKATPLHYAAWKGDEAIIVHLLDRGAKVEAVDSNYNSALLHAAYKGYDGVVNILLQRGADVEVVNLYVETVARPGLRPIHYAAANGYENTVNVLLDHGAQINVV